MATVTLATVTLASHSELVTPLDRHPADLHAGERHDEGLRRREITTLRPRQPLSLGGPSVSTWWSDTGVHQNLASPVHPDPVSGMQCWHQAVKVGKAVPGDNYGDVFVDTKAAHDVYLRWKDLCRPAPGPSGLRRPTMVRPRRPSGARVLRHAHGGREVTSARRNRPSPRPGALRIAHPGR